VNSVRSNSTEMSIACQAIQLGIVRKYEFDLELGGLRVNSRVMRLLVCLFVLLPAPDYQGDFLDGKLYVKATEGTSKAAAALTCS
jgi:hypothetical protein